jgi:uncharacterized coiled-coil protein SlyX
MALTHQEETNQKLNNDITAIHAKVDHIKDQLNIRMDELHSTLKKIMTQSQGNSSCRTNPQVKGIDSSNPIKFHSNHDPSLLRVEVNKFDGLDPTS